jgi:hypothetical protein
VSRLPLNHRLRLKPSASWQAKSRPSSLGGQGGGAIIINIDGKDYAVNGMASSGYPPIQDIWNKAAFPETDTDRLIARGLTLCDW